MQPVYFYKTLLTYSAVYLPYNSHNGGLVRIIFKVENLTAKSGQRAGVPALYNDVHHHGCWYCHGVATVLTFSLWDELDKGRHSVSLFQYSRVHCCSHTQVLNKINTFLILNACSHGTK